MIMITTTTIITPTNIGLNRCEHGPTYVVLFFGQIMTTLNKWIVYAYLIWWIYWKMGQGIKICKWNGICTYSNTSHQHLLKFSNMQHVLM